MGRGACAPGQPIGQPKRPFCGEHRLVLAFPYMSPFFGYAGVLVEFLGRSKGNLDFRVESARVLQGITTVGEQFGPECLILEVI